MKSKMFEIAHVWAQAWENLLERVASCEEERLCVLASLCLSTTLHLLLYWYKRNTAECTQKPILLCGEATLSTKLHGKHWWKARHRSFVHISVYRKDDLRKSGRHTWIHDASSSSSWIIPKRLFPDLWEILFFLVQARTPFPHSQSPLNPPIHCL